MIKTRANRAVKAAAQTLVRHSAAGFKSHVMATVSAAGLMAMAASQASAQTAPQEAQAPAVEEVVVTGSRIVRNGYEAPTPVTVLGSDELNKAATTTIAESVNLLPEFSNSVTPRDAQSSVSTGIIGANALNLRGLGASRTLVLLDGQRMVGATIGGYKDDGGAVDANLIPSGLVQRVDVVTGGASAAYGSDALSGVVNFVLNESFTGIKGEVDGGVTTYGDDRQYKINVTAGTPFANDRGHFLLFGEDTYTDGIDGNPRPWGSIGKQIYTNPAYGTGAGKSTSVPQYITLTQSGLATAAAGGIVVSGPLKGLTFGPGGTPYQFMYGSVLSGNLMSGGQWASNRIDNDIDLDPNLTTQNLYSRLSYDVTDNFQVYSVLQWGYTRADTHTVPNFYFGTLTLASNNAFFPASVRAQMAANNVTSVAFGTVNGDIPSVGADNDRTFRRFVIGAKGKFDAFGSNWAWDSYFEESSTHSSAKAFNDIIAGNYKAAIDAVTGPNGAIICSSTLNNPSNGCIPFNIVGVGVNSEAALNYVTGVGYGLTVLTQDAGAVSVNGEPFSSWAGPVSLAAGAEWRREAVGGISSPLDQANAFFVGNYHATIGEYSVAEGFLETVVPLAKDQSWAKSLDLNAAIRATSYTTSGYVTTWKVGATYDPIDDLRLRVTRSRDIRAPNLGELFSAGRSGVATVTDDFRSNAPATAQVLTIGNSSLTPEEADTTGVGVVLSPRFLSGFQASVDYYNIDIAKAISAPSNQQVVDGCFLGVTALCPFIIRNAAGVITNLDAEPANINSINTSGLDIEVSYKMPLSEVISSWNGDLTFRALTTNVFHLNTVTAFGTTDGAGAMLDTGSSGLVAPKFRYNASVEYHNDPLTVTLTARGLGSGMLDTAFVACTSACPVSTTLHPTIDNNYVPAINYFDLSFNYQFVEDDHVIETFLTIENLANQAPPNIPGSRSTGYYQGPGTATFYDRLGRFFHAGVRFKL